MYNIIVYSIVSIFFYFIYDILNSFYLIECDKLQQDKYYS